MSNEIVVFGCRCRLDYLVIFLVLIAFILGQTCFSCYKVNGFVPKGGLGYSSIEGFGGISGTGISGDGPSAYGPNTYAQNTKSWGVPSLVVKPGQPLSPGVQNILNRTPQPIPLPEGELDMFANTPFKPECCPNEYSNSSGCACMTVQQYNYVIERGGNNVPYSEY
jgi:hypothetical protein